MGNGPFPVGTDDLVINDGLVPQSFPDDQPVSVAMRQWGNINVKISEGQTLAMTVDVQGTPPYVYRWYYNGRIIDGASGSSLKIENIKPSNQAIFYSVSISKGNTRAASSEVYVTVVPKVSD